MPMEGIETEMQDVKFVLSLSLKHETTRETQTNFSNLSTSTIH
jgi:hypothetical protein